MIRILPGLSVRPMLANGDRVHVVTRCVSRVVVEEGVYVRRSGPYVQVTLDVGPTFWADAADVCRTWGDVEDRLDGCECRNN